MQRFLMGQKVLRPLPPLLQRKSGAEASLLTQVSLWKQLLKLTAPEKLLTILSYPKYLSLSL